MPIGARAPNSRHGVGRHSWMAQLALADAAHQCGAAGGWWSVPRIRHRPGDDLGQRFRHAPEWPPDASSTPIPRAAKSTQGLPLAQSFRPRSAGRGASGGALTHHGDRTGLRHHLRAHRCRVAPQRRGGARPRCGRRAFGWRSRRSPAAASGASSTWNVSRLRRAPASSPSAAPSASNRPVATWRLRPCASTRSSMAMRAGCASR